MMKLITAIIQPDHLRPVREALNEAGIQRITVCRVTGHGKEHQEEIYRGQVVVPDLIPKVRIDIGLEEQYVQAACDAIRSAGIHEDGRIGDGKIFVTPLEQAIKIRSGETGVDAL